MKDWSREFTLLRGWGIALVVLGHCLDPFLSGAFLTGLKSLIYSFHIPLFFFLSGFFGHRLFRDDEEAVSRVLRKQALRLLLPYFFCSLMAIPVKLALNRFADRPMALQSLWADILIYPHNNPMIHLWFLYALFMVQAFFIAFHRFTRIDFRRPFPAVAVVSLLGIAHQFAYSFPTELALRDIARNSVYFLAGHLAFLGYPRLANLGWKLKLPLLLAAPAYLGFAHFRQYPFAPLAFAFLGISLSWLLARALNRLGDAFPVRLLEMLGAYSMDIYLFHYLMLVSVRILFLQVFGITNPWLILAFFPVGALGPIALSKYLVRRNPRLMLVALGRGPEAGPAMAEASSRD